MLRNRNIPSRDAYKKASHMERSARRAALANNWRGAMYWYIEAEAWYWGLGLDADVRRMVRMQRFCSDSMYRDD